VSVAWASASRLASVIVPPERRACSHSRPLPRGGRVTCRDGLCDGATLESRLSIVVRVDGANLTVSRTELNHKKRNMNEYLVFFVFES